MKMKMKYLNLLVSAMAIGLFCVGACAFADDIEDEIKTGLDAYNAKQYKKAISSLEFATQQIRQLKAEKLVTLFPEPLSGWQAQEPKSAVAGAMFMGGVLSGSRIYTKDESSIEIDIAADNPMISVVSSILSNPMMMSVATGFNEGARVEKIKGEKAIVDWDSQKKSGSIQMVVADKVLVAIKGNLCEKSDIQLYAEAINYEEIRSFLSGDN
ncbi:MAG: hypothetical protein V2A72_06860 [Candidatus Omnitrophota bacterium]